MIEKIILKKSSVLDKMPTAEQLDYGELAINYNAEHPFLSFKDSDGDIMPLNDYSQDIQDLMDNKLDVSYYYEFTSGITQNSTDISWLKKNSATKEELIVDKKDLQQEIIDTKNDLDLAIAEKVAKTDIAQTTGTSETSVMSQKASTMAFAANTPSGDPMHNLYLSIGAVWNSDTGFWEMNTLTDLTNEDMSNIYTMGFVRPLGHPRFEFGPFSYGKRDVVKARTTVKSYYKKYDDIKLIFPSFTWNYNIEVINFLDKYAVLKIDTFVCFSYCRKLKKILDSVSITTDITLNECEELEEVYFLLNYNISFIDSPKLSIASVKYMIENASSSAITITLHPTAYERAIADTGVQTALANKTNVSLAKGE